SQPVRGGDPVGTKKQAFTRLCMVAPLGSRRRADGPGFPSHRQEPAAKIGSADCSCFSYVWIYILPAQEPRSHAIRSNAFLRSVHDGSFPDQLRTVGFCL